jgi:hypothetical protein
MLVSYKKALAWIVSLRMIQSKLKLLLFVGYGYGLIDSM